MRLLCVQLFAALCALALAARGVPQAAPAPAQAEPPQIHWQRSFEDALSIAADERRPLLLVLNMDGESASERIVREQYRDPGFVASTRPFVCVVASVFRHAPRDHADDGSRIACPRLGEVTCGEHIALEPVLYERLGGERIAPRHALIEPDGSVPFDLSLLFDLSAVDRALAARALLAPPVQVDVHPRSHRARLALEDLLAAGTEDALCAWFDRGPRPGGAEMSLDAMRRVWRSVPGVAAHVTDRALATEREAAAATVVRELLQDVGPELLEVELGPAVSLLGELWRLAPADASNRSLLLSYRVGDAAARREVAHTLGLQGPERAGVDPTVVLGLGAQWAPDPNPAAAVELPSESDFESELSGLEELLAARPGDPELERRRGLAALGLARRRIESGGGGIEFLLDDARRGLARASEEWPDDAGLWIERARTAYYLSSFEEQEAFAAAAYRTLPESLRSAAESLLTPPAEPGPRQALVELSGLPHGHEALRWMGDASARLLAARSGGPTVVESDGIVSGARALSLAALAPSAEATDWRTLSGYFAALGRRREEIAFAKLGLQHFPESDELRAALQIGLASLGRPERLVMEARDLAQAHPSSAVCAWYEGYAHFLLADWSRRGERPDEAIAEYDRACAAFARSLELEPSYSDSVEHYTALAALGRGFAHLLAERRTEAARELVAGIREQPAIAAVRDGLDREAVDLLDAVLEWRAAGESPVDALDLLDELLGADPDNPYWARAVSDSSLREALRAEGRGDEPAAEPHWSRAVAAGRRLATLSLQAEDAHAAAQAATCVAERRLRQGRNAEARELLELSAAALGFATPGRSAGPTELVELAARLRGRLGDARPIPRPGR